MGWGRAILTGSDALPADAGCRHGDQPRRLGHGVVRGRRRDQPVVHLPGRVRDGQPRRRRGSRGLHRRVPAPAGDRPALPHLLPRRAQGQRRRGRCLRRRRAGPHRARPARRAEPLRRGDLVLRRRHRHPHPRTWAGQRRPARARRDARVPRLPQRGRQGRLHERLRRQPVHRQRRWPALRPQGRDRLRAAPSGCRRASLPPARRLRRRDQRRAAVLVRRLRRRRGRRPRRPRQGLRPERRRRPVHRADLGAQRAAERQEPGRHDVLRRDERHPAGRAVQGVRELALGRVGQAGWAVRPAHGDAVRLLPDR